jgi:hypothetical protein
MSEQIGGVTKYHVTIVTPVTGNLMQPYYVLPASNVQADIAADPNLPAGSTVTVEQE